MATPIVQVRRQPSHPAMRLNPLHLNAPVGVPREVGTETRRRCELSDTLETPSNADQGVAERIDDLIPVRYLVLDGYFGHNNALQMTKQCGLALISKLRVNTALYFPSTLPYAGRGRPRSTGSVSIHSRWMRNTGSLPRRKETLQLKCIKRSCAIKSSRIH